MRVTEIIWVEIVYSCNTLHLERVIIQNAVQSFFCDNLNLGFWMEPDSWSKCPNGSLRLVPSFETDVYHSSWDSRNHVLILGWLDYKLRFIVVDVDVVVERWREQEVCWALTFEDDWISMDLVQNFPNNLIVCLDAIVLVDDCREVVCSLNQHPV